MNRISVIIPAHNEEQYISKCLASIRAAAERVDLPVEIVVVLNRCSDGTRRIAERSGAFTVEENARNLARIRNAGVQASTGDVLATIDADSWMSRNMLQEILRLLATGKYVGGGVRIKAERMSLGIFCSIMTFVPRIALQGLSAGLFWLKRKDFDAINGFSEELVSAEDVDFAARLKAYGAAGGLRFGTILRAYILTSCRKFDRFGDWYLIRNPHVVDRLLSGRDREAADRFYYDFDR
jgi:glycosyltransferase involved in cell wall biosynthesis